MDLSCAPAGDSHIKHANKHTDRDKICREVHNVRRPLHLGIYAGDDRRVDVNISIAALEQRDVAPEARGIRHSISEEQGARRP